MAEEVLLLAAACVVITIIISVLMLLQKERAETDAVEEDNHRPRGVPIIRGQAGEAPPRRAGRNVRARMRAAAVRQEEPELEEEEDPLIDEIVMPEGKIGAKKRKKLEMKAEKRLQREREVEEREERKQREKELEEKRRIEEEKAKEEELKKEAEEKALKEEQEQRELEEYLKLKEAFEVEEEGFDEDENAEDTHKFQEFINYIKEQKVVLLEDLASHFKLKTQDVISRIQDLLSQESIIGVIDDRGKFIYITREELESVAQFMRQRGRVSITELAECSNTLINLLPETSVS